MSNRLIRVRPAMLLIPAALVAVLAGTTAQAADPVAHYTATTININPGNGSKSDGIKIDLLRWSTDAERDQLVAAFKDEKQFLDVLQKQPTVGYIWTSGSVGFSLRYAYRTMLAGGMERIILATDRRIDSGGSQPWKATLKPNAKEYPFTVVELHVTKAGVGEGKMSVSAMVTTDNEAKTIALEGYAAAPLALRAGPRPAAASATPAPGAAAATKAPAAGATAAPKKVPPKKAGE